MPCVASVTEYNLVADPMSIEGSRGFNASLHIYAVDKAKDVVPLLRRMYRASIFNGRELRGAK